MPIASLEILQDPADDQGKPGTQRVRVLVRPVLNANGEDVLAKIDPSRNPDFPVNAGKARNDFVRGFAPKAVLVAEYTHRRVLPLPATGFYGDDPRNFVAFNPTPLPIEGRGVVANENVSPFAGAIVRFSKPIDMATLIALDTVFFATRNLLDKVEIAAFVKSTNMDPTKFVDAKFRTPHLLHSRIFDEDGSQTSIRVQPTLGFYLDEPMRKTWEGEKALKFERRSNHYFLHLVSGLTGIKDLSGNPLDFQSQAIENEPVVDSLVMEFELDNRKRPNGQPNYTDNIVAYVVRRFADLDEDEKPNYYLSGEVTPNDGKGLTPALGWRSEDLFGPVSYLPSGELVARPTARTTKVVDDLNQISAPPQTDPLRWCPAGQIIFQSAGTVFGQPIQNPLNPYGCRLQTVWRDIDMSLSRTNPLDFNLDVEQMYWAPFAGSAITFDEFDRVSLYLGHGEFRPEACISPGGAFPSMPQSGLKSNFELNYAHNLKTDGKVGYRPQNHPAYVDKVLTISAKDAITEPNGVNRFLPLPKFEDATKVSGLKNPYFVWRDEQSLAQGGVNGVIGTWYLLSPWLGGKGQRVTGAPSNVSFASGYWYSGRNLNFATSAATDSNTGGSVGTVALPLMADFWTYPDSPEKPVGDPYLASGINGWQVSLAATSSPRPDFRAYSAGRGGGQPSPIDPTHANWKNAAGGFTPGGGGLPGLDNTVYWIMTDFLKRTAVVTSGFVEVSNPHRMPPGGDPRLGPYSVTNKLPDFVYDFEPPLASLPSGTGVVTEFRGASVLDTQSRPWPSNGSNPVNVTNFPLDPLKGGDAHMRHYDNRIIPGGSVSRDWWTYMYNRTVTEYTEDPKNLVDTGWTNKFSGPNESFTGKDVKYFNWRFIMKNNTESSPPVSPKIESFAISYRFL